MVIASVDDVVAIERQSEVALPGSTHEMLQRELLDALRVSLAEADVSVGAWWKGGCV